LEELGDNYFECMPRLSDSPAISLQEFSDTRRLLHENSLHILRQGRSYEVGRASSPFLGIA